MRDTVRLIPALLIVLTLGACDLAGDLFEVGFWVSADALRPPW